MSVRTALWIIMLGSLLPITRVLAEAPERQRVYAVYWRGCEESCQGFKDYLARLTGCR